MEQSLGHIAWAKAGKKLLNDLDTLFVGHIIEDSIPSRGRPSRVGCIREQLEAFQKDLECHDRPTLRNFSASWRPM